MIPLKKSSSIVTGNRIDNPYRILELISNVIDFLKLDLTGLTVLTEAASGPYVVTPIIALMSNAKKVIALTSDSPYACVQEVILQTRAIEKICGQNNKIEIHTDRSLNLFSQADIITNLGFVRPIDDLVISVMKSTAVIPYMCEGWEIRTTDIDFDACKKKGIPILGTNEEFPGLNILSYCGWLCIYMMMEAKVELPHTRILVVSGDKFGPIIVEELKKMGLSIHAVSSLRGITKEILSQFDTIIIADYTSEHEIIGSQGDVSPADLARMKPSISVIQFAGMNEIEEILRHNFNIFPAISLPPHRMALTLAELGPRPVIELHASGLKVGEMLARARKEKNFSVDEAIQYVMDNCLGSPIYHLGKNKNG